MTSTSFDTSTSTDAGSRSGSRSFSGSGAGAVEHQESSVARSLESQTARIGSDRWLWASFASMGLSLTLQLVGRKEDALFVGQWAAPFMLIGVYNKLVKIGGSDQLHPA